MRKPSIHLNGTSRESLQLAYHEAYSSVAKALEAVQGAYPNARDYYPQGQEAFSEAANEHYDRIHRLEAVYSELAQIYQHLFEDE
jgi:hypothetical protein